VNSPWMVSAVDVTVSTLPASSCSVKKV
jgi:hypothetical protein